MDTPQPTDASNPDLVPRDVGRLLRFPTAPRKEKAIGRERDAARAYLKETAEFCEDAHNTRKQIRYQVIRKLIYTVGLLDRDTRILPQLLDVGPSVLEGIITGETDALTTETLLSYLALLVR